MAKTEKGHGNGVIDRISESGGKKAIWLITTIHYFFFIKRQSVNWRFPSF